MENQNPVSAVRVSRRSLMKAGVAASAAKIAGIPITVIAANEASAAEQGIKWTKGVCRFCGTGCGLLVGTKNGKIVATKGDPDCDVNRGLTCIKGYYNSEIIYGKDRLTQPLMRRTNGKFDKNGKFDPCPGRKRLMSSRSTGARPIRNSVRPASAFSVPVSTRFRKALPL